MALGARSVFWCREATSCEHDKQAMPRHSLPTTDGSSPPRNSSSAVEFLGFLDVRHVTAVLENNDLGQQPPISAPALGLQRLKPAASLNVHAMALLTSLGFLHRKLLV
jgi:hypothetical protein